ncbi:MAG: transposase [Oscillospiraceae bacterium]|nr:transposase [Oscillospiraceae bacterium]
MKLPKRIHPRLPEFDYSSEGDYFLTLCAAKRINLFSQIRKKQDGIDLSATVELTPLGKMINQYIASIPNAYPGVQITSYVIMPDHVHMIVRLPRRAESSRPTVPQIVGAFKRLTNRACGQKLWQTSYYDHVIRNEQDLHTRIEYIETNPLRHLLKQE